MYTDWPGIYTYEEINARLFVNPGRNDNIHDTPSKAWWHSPAHLYRLNQKQFMWQFVDAQVPPVRITMQQALEQYEADLMDEQAEIAANQGPAIGRKRWKTKEGVYQLKDPEKLEQASPNTDEATYAEMLRDVWETDNFATLDGLCHRFTFGDLGFFFAVFWLWVLCFVLLFCFPRFRDLSSSFAKSNDRLSCHGAHGMGEKKIFLFVFGHSGHTSLPTSSLFCCPVSNVGLRLVFDSFQLFIPTWALYSCAFTFHC